MRDLRFIFDARKRGAELFEQGALVTSKRRAARASAGEVAQMDQELSAKATISVGRGLGEESCKQHQRHRYADENSQGRVQKCDGVVRHDVVDIRCEGEVRSHQKA